MTQEDSKKVVPESAAPEAYEPPEIVDYGTLEDLTKSGSAPLSDTWGGAAGGGS